VKFNRDLFAEHERYETSATGQLLAEMLDLAVHWLQSRRLAGTTD
jgi:methylglyoxal synthase